MSEKPGHLSVRVSDAHPPEIVFAFAARPDRMAGSFAATVLLQAAIVAAILLLGGKPHPRSPVEAPPSRLNDQIVWLQPGPGGGGGGGGNRTPDPPRPAESVGRQTITIPVAPAAPVEPSPPRPEEAPVVQPVSIPAVSMAASIQNLPGIVAAPGPMLPSQGSGTGGGGGTGDGGGSGPGHGPGLGPGFAGNTGGSAFGPGSGAAPPTVTFKPNPTYTAEAMRARIEGTARVQCIVQPTGVCEDVEIIRSLDRTFGLDLQAINNVKQWRFRPAMRLGQPVPYQITIDVQFNVR